VPEPSGIAPSPVLHVQVPAIGVDANVLPVDSKPTGRKNAWGGDIYSTIDFPVDEDVRQWVRRGDPNSLSASESAGDVKAFDRVLLYGHASDIGNHLVFQDLASLKAGDSVIATTALGTFTYDVTAVYSRAKTNLNSLAALYDYPTDGKKELALIACLPDTTSNVVVFATLVDAQALPN
jgi:LPXTG-site transpeptidase (sortase) family protein